MQQPVPLPTKGQKGLIIGNPKNELLLTQMVYQYGEGKWSDIARGLRIHGVHVDKPNSLLRTWNKINPANQKLTHQMISHLVKLSVETQGDVKKYIALWYQTYGEKTCLDHQLISIGYYLLAKCLKKLSMMFCQKKTATLTKIKKTRKSSIMKFISMASCQSQSPFMKKLQEESIKFGELIIIMIDNFFELRTNQYHILSQIMTRRRFEEIFEYIILLDDLCKIRDKSYGKNKDLISKSKYLAPTLKENQETELYKYLFTDLQFVKYYNDAKDTINSDFVMDLQFKQTKNNLTKHTLIEVQKKPRKKTVRGRISYDSKKIFPSHQSDKFMNDLLNNLDDDQESDQNIRNHMQALEQRPPPIPPSKNQPCFDQIEATIASDVKLKKKVDNIIKQLKYTAYMEHLNETKQL